MVSKTAVVAGTGGAIVLVVMAGFFIMQGTGNDKYTIVFGNKTELVWETHWHMVNTSYEVPVFKNVTVEVPCTPSNETCFPCTNISMGEWCKDWTHTIVDHWDTKWHMVNTSYQIQVEKQVPDICHRIGIIDKHDVFYPGIYNVDVKHKNKVYQWMYPQACRNYDEYANCREFEEGKNVCWEVKI